jgi:hypothetical protein
MYMFFGDSHSRQFIGVSWGILSHYVFSRASMKGLVSQTSALRHGGVIAHAIASPREKLAFLMFGGVDIDFSFPREVCHGEVGFEEFTADRIAASRSFVERLFNDPQTERHLRRLYLLAPQVSPLLDGPFFRHTPEIAGVEESALRAAAERCDFTHRARAERVHVFNDRLADAFAGVDRVSVLRVDRAMVDETGCIGDLYQSGDPMNHHADGWAMRELWRPQIEAALQELPPPWDNEC